MKHKFFIIFLITFQLLATGCGQNNRTLCKVITCIPEGKKYLSIGVGELHLNLRTGERSFSDIRLPPGNHNLTVKGLLQNEEIENLFEVNVDCKLGYTYFINEDHAVAEMPNGTSLSNYLHKRRDAKRRKIDEEYTRRIEAYNEERQKNRRDAKVAREKEKEEYWRKVKKTNDALEASYKKIRELQDNKIKKQLLLRKEYRKKHPFEYSIKVTNGKLKGKYKKILEGSKKEFLKSLKTHDLTGGINLHGVYKYDLVIKYNGNFSKFFYTLNVSNFAPKESLVYRDNRSKFDYVNLNGLSAFSSIVSVWIDEVMKTTDDEVFKAILNRNQTIIIVLNRKIDKKNVKVFIKSELYTKTNKLGFKNIMIYKTKDKEESFKAYSDSHLKLAKYFYFKKDTSSKKGQKYDKVERVFFAKKPL